MGQVTGALAKCENPEEVKKPSDANTFYKKKCE